MRRRSPALATLAALALVLAAPHAPADRVITEDGRILKPRKARQQGEGYVLEFESGGEIVLPDDAGIKAIEIEGDMADYVPANDDEREKLEQGYIRYQGKWWSKPGYEAQLAKEYEAAKERADLIAAHSEWHECWEKETRHFLVKSNTSPELLDYYADLLEAYYALMDDRVGIKPTPTYRRKKMTVNVYKSREEFYKYSPADIGPSTLGYFWAADDTLNFFHDYAEPALSDWVALHECTHLLTFLIDQQYVPQIWLNEAVADYFGSADIERDKRGRFVITPGKLQTDRVLTVQQAIEKGNDTKLADLFFIDRADFNGFQYAHAWSFVYFLANYDDGEYERGFKRFFKELYTLQKEFAKVKEVVPHANVTGTGYRVPPEAIREGLLDRIGVRDLDQLEREWKGFVAAIPIESGPARLKRGLRRVNSFDTDKADETLADFDAAIEAGVTDPRAWSGRARAKLMKGDFPGAVKDLEQAVERDPLNASFRFQLSQLLAVGSARGARRVEASSGGDRFENEAARLQAGLAMELDPDNEAFAKWFQRFE